MKELESIGHNPNMVSVLPTPRASALIVDDDAGVRDVCTVMLRSLGYRARAESCAADALAALHTSTVELVLLDLQMPSMTGAELLPALKQRRPGVRVVVMSGSSQADLDRYLSQGADAVIRKPFRLAELGRAISALSSFEA
jgi:CheY-like chemotaxis protein